MAATAAILCASSGAYAQHYKFSPPRTTFSASGPAYITKGTDRLACTMTMKMKTSAKGKLKITAASFTGDDGCGTADHLPWKVKSPNFEGAFIFGFEFTSSLGDCSYPEVPMFLEDGTILVSFQFPDCGDGLVAQLTTTPTLALVPK
jgi:hypothetical protein